MASLAVSLLLVLAAHLPAALATRCSAPPIPPQQLITSPQSCLSDLECAPDQYCKAPPTPQDDFMLLFGFGAPEASTCVPRLPEGSACTMVGTVECEEGTFCGFEDDFNPAPVRCLRQAPEGSRCALTATKPCRGDLVCEIEPVCRPFTFGVEGDFCRFDRHCQQQQGFFCRDSVSRCTAKRPPGAECETEANNFECEGFCVSSGSLFGFEPGTCQRLQTAGEKCIDHTNCQSFFLAFQNSRDARVICNRPTASAGVCVLETDLIRQLGAVCDPSNDACDARRGLSCARVGRQFKCVQRGDSESSIPFCTPNSPLSSCPPGDRGNLRECRRSLSLSKQFTGTFACRTRRQVVPLGNPCSDKEFAVCPRGAVCAEAPGVLRPSGRFPPPPLRACMKVVPVGAVCTDQFRFKCEEGSFCVDGTCRRANASSNVPVAFAPVNGDCSELSCPPGTVCTGEPGAPDSFRSCRLPVREAGLWQPCFEAAQFQLTCKDNLQCSQNFLGEGVRACRPKRGIGGICEDDSSCIGDLECDPSFRTNPFQRRCFDPALSLNIGDSCTAHPRADEPRCVAAVETDPNFQYSTSVVPLMCLPKNGTNVCQRPVGLFQKCSTENNIACATGDLVCSRFNVCVPKSQV